MINGLDVSGNGAGCNQLTGQFVVREIVLNGDGTVSRFAADFEQHCEDQHPGLFGAIRYNSTISDLVPFAGDYPNYELTLAAPANGRITAAGIDCGDGATACSLTLASPAQLRLTATPAAGYAFAGWSGDCSGAETIWLQINQRKQCSVQFMPGVQGTTALLLDSEAGDPIGQGLEQTLTQLDGTFEVLAQSAEWRHGDVTPAGDVVVVAARVRLWHNAADGRIVRSSPRPDPVGWERHEDLESNQHLQRHHRAFRRTRGALRIRR